MFDVYLPYSYDLEEIVEIVNEGKISMMDALDIVEFFFIDLHFGFHFSPCYISHPHPSIEKKDGCKLQPSFYQWT